MEALGFKAGTEVELRPKVNLVPRSLPPAEAERRRAIVQKLTGIWTAEDEAAYRKYRREMWATWKPHGW
jgi:hypothetical protein